LVEEDGKHTYKKDCSFFRKLPTLTELNLGKAIKIRETNSFDKQRTKITYRILRLCKFSAWNRR